MKKHIQGRGFTLLELLVVIVIIGIMSSIITMSISAPNYARFKADVKKIAITLSILNDQAMYSDSVIVCKVETSNLSCKSYKNGEWSDLNINKLVSWQWPKSIFIKQVYINDSLMTDDQKIYFMPTGAQVPISFLVSNNKYNTWIDGDLNGIFHINN